MRDFPDIKFGSAQRVEDPLPNSEPYKHNETQFQHHQIQINDEKIKDRPVILLVDDEEPNRHHVAGLEEDFEVITAEDGVMALDILRRADKIEVVVSDHIMPNMTGVELCTELKKRQNSERILVTGFAELDSVVSAVNDAAIFRYLTKPVKSAQLIEASVRHPKSIGAEGKTIHLSPRSRVSSKKMLN